MYNEKIEEKLENEKGYITNFKKKYNRRLSKRMWRVNKYNLLIK